MIPPLFAALALAEPQEAALLFCEGEESCAEEASWVEALSVLQDRPLVTVEAALALDSANLGDGSPASRFREALTAADQAAIKGRWRPVEEQLALAESALSDWAGSPLPEELFDFYVLQGAARLHRGEDESYHYSFRQAIALYRGNSYPALPTDDDETRQAWLDARRVMSVEGEGTLSVTLPEGARLYVDGAYEPDPASVTLRPGNHRLVVEHPDQLRPRAMDVPVLAGRSTALSVELPPTERAAWLDEQLDAAFAGGIPPQALVDLLVDWCEARGLTALQLLRVERDTVREEALEVDLSAAPALRPEAADGEPVDMGEGVPVTGAEEVERRYQEALAAVRPEEHPRLQALWFDPATRRFDLYQPPPAPTPPDDTRLSVGVSGGYAAALSRHHAAAELAIDGRWRSFGAAGRAGIYRADEDYRLYPGWSDAVLWHGSAGALWSPDWRLAPAVGLGLEAVFPVAIGPRAWLGAEIALTRGWEVRLEAGGSYLDGGLGASLSAGVSRVF